MKAKLIKENLNEAIVDNHVEEFREKLIQLFPDLESFEYHPEGNYIEIDMWPYSEEGMNELDDAVRELIKTDFGAAGWDVIDDNYLYDLGDYDEDEFAFYHEESIFIKLPDYYLQEK